MTSAVHDHAAARLLPAASGEWLKSHGKWFIILPPLLFLLVFFLIPFGFALVISFADTAVRVFSLHGYSIRQFGLAHPSHAESR